MDLLDPPGLAICLLWGMPYVWGFPTLYPIPSGCYGLAYGIPLPGYGTPYAWLYGTLIPARDWLLGPTGYTLRYAIGGGGWGFGIPYAWLYGILWAPIWLLYGIPLYPLLPSSGCCGNALYLRLGFLPPSYEYIIPQDEAKSNPVFWLNFPGYYYANSSDHYPTHHL